MGRLCGERGTAQALRAPAGRKKRVSPHPAPKHLKPPRTTPKRPRASRCQPTAARPAPSPSFPRIYPRIYVPLPGRFGCPAARARSCRSRRVPAPAACAVGAHQPRTAQALRASAGRKKRASPHPAPKHPEPPRTTPNHPEVPRAPAPAAASPQPATSSRSPRTFAVPSPSLPRIYPGIYAPLPGRFGCPAARVRSCRSRRVPPSRPPKGARGKRPLPRRKTSAGAELFRRPYLGTTARFIPLTLSMAYRTASMVWLSWSGYRGRTRPLRSRSYS